MEKLPLNQDKDGAKIILSKEVVLLIFCSIFTLANPLTYQIFLGQGPNKYLQMYFIIMLPVGGITFLVRILGHSLLVVLPKKESLFSSVFMLALSLIMVLLTILYFTQDFFLKVYEINYRLASVYYKLTIISVSIMAINSILNYYLIFRKNLFCT